MTTTVQSCRLEKGMRVSVVAYGTQGRLLLEFWRDGRRLDWADRIVYLPQAG